MTNFILNRNCHQLLLFLGIERENHVMIYWKLRLFEFSFVLLRFLEFLLENKITLYFFWIEVIWVENWVTLLIFSFEC